MTRYLKQSDKMRQKVWRWSRLGKPKSFGKGSAKVRKAARDTLRGLCFISHFI